MNDIIASLNRDLSFVSVGGSVKPGRLLAKSLGVRIMGIDVTGRLYGQNGFRFIGTPSNVDRNTFELCAQRVRNLEKLGASAASKMAIRLGYESHLGIDDASECVLRLNDPPWRAIYELFWPKLSDELFAQIRKERSIISRAVLDQLVSEEKHSADPWCVQHALAIVHHNLALTGEIGHLTTQAEWPQEHWEKSLTYWTRTLESPAFWEHLRALAKDLGDPRFKPDDVNDELRRSVAGAVLGFNSLFATAYARMGRQDMYRRHHELIVGSSLAQAAKDQTLTTMVRGLTGHQLEPLVQRARNPEGQDYYEGDGIFHVSCVTISTENACPRCGYCFAWDGSECQHCGFTVSIRRGVGESPTSRQAKKFPTSGKVAWKCFSGLYDPIVAEAEMLRGVLNTQLNIPSRFVQLAAFDDLCEVILGALKERIDYSQDTERAILYSLIACRRMSRLPLSTAVSRRLHEAVQNDTRNLYADIKLPADLDVAECWFLPDEPADPQCSLTMSTYKIISESTFSVQYRTKHVLIPRSRAASLRHQGQITDADVPKHRIGGASERYREIRDACETRRAAQQQVLSRRDHNIKRAKAIGADYGRKIDAAAGAQEQKDRARVAQADTQRRAGQRKIDRWYEKAQIQIDERFAPKLQEHEDAYQAVASQVNGLGGLLRIRLPLATLGVGVSSVAAVPVWFYVTHSPAVWLLVGGGLLCGLVVGKIISMKRLGVAQMPLKRVQEERDRQLGIALAKKNKAEGKVLAAFEEATAEAQKRLGRVEAKRRKVSKQVDAAIQRLNKEGAEKVQQIGREIETLWQQIDEKVKGESHKKKFPGYKNAKASGYRDGTKPPDDYTEQRVRKFMNSLSNEEKAALAVLMQRLPQDQFTRILEVIADKPSYERLKHFLGMLGIGGAGLF